MPHKNYLTTACLSVLVLFVSIGIVSADNSTAITNGLAYLSNAQSESGQISGFGGESQWAAIAFSTNGVSVASVENNGTSLYDYLLADIPASGAAATERERRILAIVAIGGDPSNFGGVNYVAELENLYNDAQLGETTLLNDDIFGVLALVASGQLADPQIINDSITFIIEHQTVDGGFSWTTDACDWCGADNNDTAAAIQALQVAKEAGFTHPNLDDALADATNYLLSTRNDDGGFGYDQYSDSDGSSTAWSLMALNMLDLQASESASISAQAVNWLQANQTDDGGFEWMPGFGSDTYTSSHALIALSGKAWVHMIYDPNFQPSPSPSPTATPSPSPSVSPSPNPSPSPDPSPSPSPSPTPSPTPSPSPTPNTTNLISLNLSNDDTSLPGQVRGASTQKLISDTNARNSQDTNSKNAESEDSIVENNADTHTEVESSSNDTIRNGILIVLVSLGIALLFGGFKMWEQRKGI